EFARSNSSTARRAFRPGRPACFTTRRAGRRGCSAVASSCAPMRLPKGVIGATTQRRLWRARHSGVGRAGGMAQDIDRAGVAKAYARWAPVYDIVFGQVFDSGRKASIAAADAIGGRVLDVGVGTGLSLSDYARTTRLHGVDISLPMLRKAQERVREFNLTNVESLSVMDAKHLAFSGGVFDAVVAQYVITAVPDPEATLDA